MEDKMIDVEKMMVGVYNHCEKNGIEFIFAAVSKDGKTFRVANNQITNLILKKALEVAEKILH